MKKKRNEGSEKQKQPSLVGYFERYKVKSKSFPTLFWIPHF